MGPSSTYLPPEGEECGTPVEHGLSLRAELAVGYCSRRPRPLPMWRSCFVGARAVGLWVGEQQPLCKNPPRGPSRSGDDLPTLPLVLSLKDQSKFMCQFYFEFNPVCETCSGPFFQVTKNDLQKCVLEIAAFLQSQQEVRSALLGQSTATQIICVCTSPELRLPLCCILVHSFLLVFQFRGIPPSCAAYQLSYSDPVLLG